MNAIEARNLSKQISGTPVLERLDLSVPAGSVFGLLGRNGAGKTTLFRLLLGLARADEGRVGVLGEDLNASSRVRSRIGYVADTDILPGWAALRDVVEFEHRLRTSWNAAALDRWCSTEGLRDEHRVAHLSKGQRKRFEIELALAGRPEVLLLDEPFANLDPVAKHETLGMLLEHAVETGATVLLSSHVLPDLERVCDRVGILTGGRISLVVALDELKESGAIVTRLDATSGSELPGDVRVLATWQDADGCTSVVTGLDDDRRTFLENHGYRIHTGNLEEIGTELLRVLGAR